jgi:hypothetical protein
MKNYLDVKIEISSDPEQQRRDRGTSGPRVARYRVRIESERGQGESTFEPPFALDELAGAVFGVAQSVRALATVTPPTAGLSAREYGEKLYTALFTGETRSIFDKTIGAAGAIGDLGVRIRIVLNLQGHGMAEVASLPWELMRAPGQAAPLVMSNRTPLVRSLDVPQPTEPQPYTPPLRILAVLSNPSGTPPLNLEEERAQITRSWALLPSVKVDFVRPVRSAILQQLSVAKYHVIHYMGHGEFSGDRGGSLLLKKGDGSPDPITGEEIGVFLADELPTLRLVFLNACKTGTTDGRGGADPFAGVATSLIRAGVPAVVAMQFPISDQAAISFAETFYQRIADSYPVDAAVAEARKVLYSEQRSEWATPVLFLRSKDGVLFGPPGDAGPGGISAPAHPPQGSVAAMSVTEAAGSSGEGAAKVFRVFLATPNEGLGPLHRTLLRKLKDAEISVARLISLPDDANEHAEAVQSLVRSVDLCIHLLGETPGTPIDDSDMLRTYPLEQLRVGLEAARSQLVLIPDEVVIDSIADPGYRSFVNTLIDRPRDSGRFELVRAGKHQLGDEILEKIARIQEARRAEASSSAAGDAIDSAYVDAHRTDLSYAQKLESVLANLNIDVTKKTSNSPTDALLQFDVRFSDYPLYIVVSGGVDKAWVENRWKAAVKSAVSQDAKAIVAVYSAPQGGTEKLLVRYDVVDDSRVKEALYAEFGRSVG